MPNSSAGYFIVNAAPAAISSTSCRPRHPLLLACLASLFFTTPGHGAAPPDAGQVLREMRGGERDMRPEKAEEPVIEALPRPAIKLPEGIRIPVGAFRVSGNSAIPSAELDALVRPWAGQTLDLAGLNDAAGAITRHYQSRGYLLSYAYLPAQKVVDGVVEIAVLEGRVDAVQVVAAQDVRLRDDVIQRHVGDIAEASTLRQADLERRLLLLNDMPGVVARGAFTPGARPGTADLVLSVVEEDPLANSLVFNNHGGDSTGHLRLGVNFQLKDIFGLGDSTRFNLLASEKGLLVNGGLNTRVPVGGDGWALEAGLGRVTYELDGAFANLGARGEATSLSLGASYPILRGLDRNLYFQAGYEHKWLRDLLTLIADETRKHSDAFSLRLSLDQRDDFLGGGRSNVSLGLLRGDLSASTTGLVTPRAQGNFNKINAVLGRQQNLGGNWSLSGHAQGQYTRDNLDSSEKLGLTGPYGVRAYGPGELTADRGALASLELRYSQPFTGGTLTWSLFHDHAWAIRDVSAPPGSAGNRVSLLGSGFGAEWRAGEDLRALVTAAWRGGLGPSVDGDSRPRVYFQLNKGF